MIATFTDRSGARVVPPAGLVFAPGRYNWRDIGGPLQATIGAEGPESDLWGLSAWLRYGVEIWDERSEPVWWGFVSAVRITAGALAITYSLADMANRVRVVYQQRNADGTTVRAVTADADDAFSQAYFGAIKEVAVRGGTLDATAAAYLRDETLATLKYFAPALEVASRDASAVSVELECAGWWQTLAWRLASVASRDEAYTELNTYGPYGSDTTYFPFGFTNGAVGTGVITVNNYPTGWYAAAQQFIISESNGNQPMKITRMSALLYRNSESPNGTVTLSVYSQASNQPGALIGSMTVLQTSSVPESNQWVVFNAVAGTYIWIMPGEYYWAVLTRNASYASSELNWIGIGGDLTGYTPIKSKVKHSAAGAWADYGSAIQGLNLQVHVEHGESTLTAGATADKQKIAQSFQIAGSASLEVGAVRLRAFRMGTLGGDLYVAICADAAGVPGTQLEEVALSPDSQIATDFDWITIPFTNGASLTPSTSYWLLISAELPGNPNAFVAFAASLAKGYLSGATKVYNGATWATPTPNVELLFEIRTSAQTSSQVARLVSDFGPLLGATTIQNASGVWSTPERDGESDALREITQLLQTGSANGRRMLARVLRDKSVTITETPAAAASLYLDRAGRLTDTLGLPAPVQACPVGVWLAPRDVVPAGAPAAPLGATTLFYVEESEYDPSARAWRPRLRGQRDPFDLGGIRL